MGSDSGSDQRFRLALEIQGGKRISGNDLFSLLEQVDIRGSLSQAASRLGLSYRYSWGLLREAERVLGMSLVEGRTGGAEGGETRLTGQGRQLLEQYRSFRREVDVHLTRLQPGAANGEQRDAPRGQLLIASTMEPVETGLLDVLEAAFYRATGVVVRHVAAGSGRALDIARAGRVDAVLTHAPELERRFMEEGWGETQTRVMANDFVLAGPAADPAKILRLPVPADAADAFRAIAATGSPFLSRADESGTHLKELHLWHLAGVEPSGDWYRPGTGLLGNIDLLRQATAGGAYALADRATVLLSGTGGSLVLFPRPKDGQRPELANTFSFITVSAARVRAVNAGDARLFASWLRGGDARTLISRFGTDTVGQPLFRPAEEESVDTAGGAGIE